MVRVVVVLVLLVLVVWIRWWLWVWGVVFRGVWVLRRGCGIWWFRVGMRFRGFRWIVVGIWRVCLMWILIVGGVVMCVRVGLLMV